MKLDKTPGEIVDMTKENPSTQRIICTNIDI